MFDLIVYILAIGYLINILSLYLTINVYLPKLDQAYQDKTTSRFGDILIESEGLIGFITGIVPYIVLVFVPLMHAECRLSRKRKTFKELCGE